MDKLSLKELIALHSYAVEQLEYINESIILEMSTLYLRTDDNLLTYLSYEKRKMLKLRNKYKRMIKNGEYTR